MKFLSHFISFHFVADFRQKKMLSQVSIWNLVYLKMLSFFSKVFEVKLNFKC